MAIPDGITETTPDAACLVTLAFSFSKTLISLLAVAQLTGCFLIVFAY